MPKLTPKKAARQFVRPMQDGLSRGITVAALTREYQRVSGQKIYPTMVFRWLMNKGKPVEPKVGAAMVLRKAFENLTRNGEVSDGGHK